MRIAAIADIHGNADALTAVLTNIAEASPDLVVNLGDHFSGPLAAGETAEILRAHPKILSIRGNHDRYLLEQSPEQMAPSDASAFAELEQSDFDWLRTIPPTLEQDGFFLCHGTPASDSTYWLEDVSGTGVCQRPLSDVEALLDGVETPVIFCAHTHLSRAVKLGTGQWVVNPGSVGCPGYDDDHPHYHTVQTGHPYASYALVDLSPAGPSIQFRTCAYDTDRMSALARSRGRDGWANAIATGWFFR